MKERTLGQYFTHPEVAKFMVDLINPKDGERVIDPSCGDGEFFKHVHNKNPNTYTYGCEIDECVYLEAKKNNPNSLIYLHDGLYSHILKEGEEDISEVIAEGTFNAVIANPPFNGLSNKIKDKDILSLFEVGHNNGKVRNSQSIEVLFLERFINLLKPDGRLCTIIPEGILSDQRLFYLRDLLYNKLSIESIISLPKRGVFNNAYVNVVILCAKKKPVSNPTKRVFYVSDTELDDLPIIFDYMKRNKIFYT